MMTMPRQEENQARLQATVLWTLEIPGFQILAVNVRGSVVVLKR